MTASQFEFSAKANDSIPLGPGEGGHVFDDPSIAAIRAAIATQRPLLVIGEPGVGKTQLARAVAANTGCPLIIEVVNSRSEPEDLLWRYDAIGRIGVAHDPKSNIGLHPSRFLAPGPIWWAFNRKSARLQYQLCQHKLYTQPKSLCQKSGESSEKPCIVLIDEIDKADVDYPNALLDVFGQRSFSVPYIDEDSEVHNLVKGGRVAMDKHREPFVIITSNGERTLPEAFVRRCWVLKMSLPDDPDEFRQHLQRISHEHFDSNNSSITSHSSGKKLNPQVVESVINELWDYREHAKKLQIPKPGQAEFIDILRALITLSPDHNEQVAKFEEIKQFAFGKHEAIHRNDMEQLSRG